MRRGGVSPWPLPELPPMPAIPARRPVASVPMGDPAAFPVTQMDFPIAPGPFAPTWESIAEHHPGMPAWLREAKFGIWVHFGAQSAGRSGDWYAKRLYLQEGKYRPYHENHLRNYGHPSEVGYKDVLRTWNPDKLDPAAQVRLYRDAGARFLFIQGVHHDNFDNWNSRYQRWNSVNLGPRRDLLREWTAAARANGLRWGAAFHHEYTWWWYQTAYGSDTTGPKAGIPYDGHLTLADGKGKWWEGYDPRMLYTIDLREYQGLDVEFAPLKGVFTNHQAYARWYATWWAYRMMDVIEHYDPDFIYTDGNSTQPFTGVEERHRDEVRRDAARRRALLQPHARAARRGGHVQRGEVQPDAARRRQHAGGHDSRRDQDGPAVDRRDGGGRLVLQPGLRLRLGRRDPLPAGERRARRRDGDLRLAAARRLARCGEP